MGIIMENCDIRKEEFGKSCSEKDCSECIDVDEILMILSIKQNR